MFFFIYNLLYMLPFCITSMIFCSPYLKIKEITPVYFTMALSVVIICELYEVLKIKGRVILTGIVLAVILAVFLFLSAGESTEINVNRFEYFLIFLVSVISFAISELIIHFRYIRLAGCGLMLAALIISMIFGASINKAGTYSVFVLSVLAILEEIQLHWKKGGNTDHRKHLVSTAPFILVLILMISAFPVNEKPYDWHFVREIIADIKESVNVIMRKIALLNGEDYFVNKIGFTDRGMLGEGVESDPDEMLLVTVSDVRDEAVYLTGKVFDTFTDGEWLNTNESKLNDRMLDTLETRCAASVFSDHVEDIMKSRNINIRYIDMQTRYMFVPDKIFWGLGGVDDYSAACFGNSMLFSEKKGYENEYYLQYFVLNRAGSRFEDFLKADTSFDSEYWDGSLSRFRFANPEANSYERLLEHRKNIYDTYLKTPELSDELRSVMDTVLEDCDNDIDKLTRIEAMLQSFEYNDMPGGFDFEPVTEEKYLDYFLLHSQSGYCSYFATAFVLLARAEGIPARYVQGYYIPVGKEKNITVTSDMAHAWPEVYIDGKGWLIYEPTPGYTNLSSWQTYDERKGEWKKYDNSYIKSLYEHDSVLKTTEEAAAAEETGSGMVIRWYVVVLPAALLATVLILLYIIEKLVFRAKKRKMTSKEVICLICRNNLEILCFLVRRKAGNETLTEYSDDIRSTMDTRLQNDGEGCGNGTDTCNGGENEKALSFIGIYERLLYSDSEPDASITGEMLVQAEESRLILEKKLKKNSRFKYLVYYFTAKN